MSLDFRKTIKDGDNRQKGILIVNADSIMFNRRKKEEIHNLPLNFFFSIKEKIFNEMLEHLKRKKKKKKKPI
jgi:hypothetical protein